MSRHCTLQADPHLAEMPNFASNGYAPSRARKWRQLNYNNDEAIQSLQQDWNRRQQDLLQIWLAQNPDQTLAEAETVPEPNIIEPTVCYDIKSYTLFCLLNLLI